MTLSIRSVSALALMFALLAIGPAGKGMAQSRSAARPVPSEATRVAVLLQRRQQGPIDGSVVAALR